MAHYNLLFNQIATHVKSAWNATTITPGRSNKPLPQLPRAVIALESCSREFAGRSVEQTWTWTIAGQFPMPALIDLLTPFSENSGSLPVSPSPFGTVGYSPQVTEWTPVPLDDEDNAVAITMSFTVRTTVWQ
jgi:hypothetical protein